MPNEQSILELSHTLFLVLLNSLWQAAAIALVSLIALRLIPARRTDVRYIISASALLLVVISALGTWSFLQLERPEVSHRQRVAQSPAGIDGDSTSFNADVDSAFDHSLSVVAPVSRSIRRITPWLIGAWIIGTSVMLVRAFRGMAEVRILLGETAASPAEATALSDLRSEMKQLCLALGIRQTATLQKCSNLASPAVVGTLWPVILLPATMLTGNTLSKEQWRIVLAHELAHVRRFDGLINLAQLLIESVLFFNPCVWWLSRQVRIEREACCDSLACRVTGQPLSVAHTLLSVAEKINRAAELPAPHSRNVTVTAIAFADFVDSGSLRDRVSRLAEPDKVPQSRLSWIGMTWLGLAASTLLLTGVAFALQQGTDVAVRSAAALLSPGDRADELARLQAVNSGVIAPPSDAEPTGDESDLARKVKVHIIVRTEDGSPIPNGVSVCSGHRQSSSGSTGSSLVHEYKSIPGLAFDKEFAFGHLRIAASAEGFAPAVSEQIALRPETESPTTVELVLTKGFEKTIRVLDENGQPISDLPVDVWGQLSAGNMSMGLDYDRSRPVSENGMFRLVNVSADAQYRLRVQSKGWEFQESTIQISKGEDAVLTVRRAKPTTFRIVDAESGKPVKDARVHLSGWRSVRSTSPPTPRTGDPRTYKDDRWVFGRSDGDGNVVVDMLNRDEKYLLAIRADGYRPEFLNSVVAGMSLAKVELSKAIVFEGKVTGDLSTLPPRSRNSQPRRMGYRNDLQFNELRYSGILYVDVDAQGRFRIDDLVPGGMKFNLPGGSVAMSSDKSRNDIVLELNKIKAEREGIEDPASQLREVVVRLQGIDDNAAIRGFVRVQWRHRGKWDRKTVPVVDRSATVYVPVGAVVSVNEHGLVGCVFEEKRGIVVASGAGPQVVDIPVYAAGGIHGTVRRADGSEATDSSIAVITIEDPPAGKASLNPSVRGSSETFFRSVPLGGTYAVLAREFTPKHTVWVVSQPFQIDENNPIENVQLKLPIGEPTTIRILDDHGRPVPNTAVSLSISHSVNGHSRSQATSGNTDSKGIADMGLVQLRSETGDVVVGLSATVTPSKGRTGWRGQLDSSKNSFTIRVSQSVNATGIVIDSKTNRPIPKAPVVVYPKDLQAAKFPSHIRTKTDEKGRFVLEGLEAVEYHVMINGTAPEGVVIRPQPNGSTRYEYPNGNRELRLTGGSGDDYRFRVQIIPGSDLKALVGRSRTD